MSVSLLGQVVALFVVSVVIAYLCYRVRLVPIAGFLIAGVLIGPGALGLVSDTSIIYDLAQVGVILLLFTIGGEFSLQQLARIKRFIIVGGGVQGGVMLAVVTLLLVLFGVGWRVGLFTGFLVVLSSTAIVLQLFRERAETDTPAAQLSLALLIFQDLAMVGMVLLVPTLAGGGASTLELVFVLLKASFVIALVLLLARRVVPWLLEQVARTRREELFLLTVVMVCFGTAWLTSLFNVSLALGAFLAGLVVSESRYSGYALSEILPLRTIFSAIFFVSIGMLLDVGFLLENLVPVLTVAAGVFVLKLAVTAGTVRLLGYPARIAAVAGVYLAQICESSFVLERAGAEVGLSPAGLGYAGEQTFVAVAVLLMVLTPLLVKAGPRLGLWLSGTAFDGGASAEAPTAEPAPERSDHVVVVGFGPAGEHLVGTLEEVDVPYVIVELNPRTAETLEREGRPVVFGDASRRGILDAAGVHTARLCVVLINDAPAVRNVVEMAHYLNPTLQLVVRARFAAEVEALREAGADVVVPEELATATYVVAHVLEAFGVALDDAGRRLELIRGETEESLRVADPVAPDPAREHAASLSTRRVTVRRGALAAGTSLEELALGPLYGVAVVAVQRGEEVHTAPPDAFRVAACDRLLLVGTPGAFEEAAHLFRATTEASERG